jgi:hypothetical protein
VEVVVEVEVEVVVVVEREVACKHARPQPSPVREKQVTKTTSKTSNHSQTYTQIDPHTRTHSVTPVREEQMSECSRPLSVRNRCQSFSLAFGPTPNNALHIRLAGYIPGSDIGLRNAKKNQPQAPRNPECFPLRPCL